MRVNCHAHVFNLRTILTPASLDIIVRRLREEISNDMLADVIADAVTDALTDIQQFDEEQWLRSVLGRLSGRAEFQQLIAEATDNLPPELAGVVAGKLESYALGQLRRAMDAFLGLFGRKHKDAEKQTLFDVLEFLRIAAKTSIRDVAQHVLKQLDPEDAVVALAMDITNAAAAGSDKKQFDAQIEGTAEAAYAFPGRVLPFFGVNPHRPDHFERLREAVAAKGYVGVKLYPSLGFEIDSPAMRQVYSFCNDHDLPLLMHCNQSGFFLDETWVKQGDPVRWVPILETFGNLKICFAHFGGSGELLNPQFPKRWAKKILDLMDRFSGVYADISYHTAPMEGDPQRRTYFDHLESVLDHPVHGERILWGTDFWLVRSRLSELNHWRFFEDHLSAAAFRQIAETNPRRFLGLPGGGAAINANLVNLVRILVDNEDQWLSPPPPWVGEAAGGISADVAAAVEARAASITPSAALRIRNFDDWVERIGDAALASNLPVDIGAEAEIDGSRLQLAGLNVGLRADAALTVRLFDDEETVDDDGVLVASEEAGSEPDASDENQPLPQAPEKLGPHIRYDADQAWLKYQAVGNLHLDAQGTLKAAGLSVGADLGVVFADYRRHPRSRKISDALLRDLRSPRFALSLSDTLRLREGEALLYRTNGGLEASVTVSWADVFGFGLNRLAAAIGSPQAIGVSVQAGAQINARVKFQDSFNLTISRGPSSNKRPYRVSVRKSKLRAAGLEASLGVVVEWEDPQQIEQILGMLVKQRLGVAESTVRRIAAKNVSQLSASERTTLGKVAEKLGVSPGQVKARYAELQEDIRRTITAIAESKITAGFTYEYSRIHTSAALLQATFTEPALGELHRGIASGNLAAITDRAAWDKEGVAIEVSLRTETLEKRQSLGLSLGLNDWTIGGTSQRRLRYVSHEAQIGTTAKRKVSYLGQRQYKGTFGKRTSGWKIDLSADMTEWSERQVPFFRDLDFSLSLAWEWRRKLTDEAIAEICDFAELWDVTMPGDGRVKAVLDGLADRTAACTLQMVLPKAVLKNVLLSAPEGDAFLDRETDFMAAALAAGMPYSDRSPALGSVLLRQASYIGLYKSILVKAATEPNWRFDPDAWARTARDHFREDDQAAVADQANLEIQKSAAGTYSVFTFAGINQANETTAQSARRFLLELRKLRTAVAKAGDDPHTDFAPVFHGLEDFWKQSHHVRAVGRYLLTRAATVDMVKDMARTLTVLWTDDAGVEQAEVVAGV